MRIASAALGAGIFRRSVCVVTMAMLGGTIATGAMAGETNGLPKYFVYLRDVAPSIIQEMRYFGEHNFVGRRVDGYNAPECLLTRPAAEGLAKLQRELLEQNLSLKVYDCYRPMTAVRHFVRWARDVDDTLTKGEFYPTIEKRLLFRKHYISKRSAHARGSTVDLTIVPLPAAPQPAFSLDDPQVPCHYPRDQRYGDNSLDFGTGFDCFHEYSHTANPTIQGEARSNRRLLVDGMRRAGFKNYSREWWHYSFRREPYRRTFFEFPIEAHPD